MSLSVEGEHIPPTPQAIKEYKQAVRHAAGRRGNRRHVLHAESGSQDDQIVVHAIKSTEQPRGVIKITVNNYISVAYLRKPIIDRQENTEQFIATEIKVIEANPSDAGQVGSLLKHTGIATRPIDSKSPPKDSGTRVIPLAEYDLGLSDVSGIELRERTALLQQATRGTRIVERSLFPGNRGRTVKEIRTRRTGRVKQFVKVMLTSRSPYP